jgi:hypothetical protein
MQCNAHNFIYDELLHKRCLHFRICPTPFLGMLVLHGVEELFAVIVFLAALIETEAFR